MAVHDFHVESVAVMPAEARAPPVVRPQPNENKTRLEYARYHPYHLPMDDHSTSTSLANTAATRKRRIAAARLQEIEGNPLTPEDIAMFEMFEREGWSHERRRAYILAGANAPAA